MSKYIVTCERNEKEYQGVIEEDSLAKAKAKAESFPDCRLISIRPMPVFRVIWEYVGIRGYEIGVKLWEAWNAEDAGNEFLKVNRPFSIARETGFIIHAIEEVTV